AGIAGNDTGGRTNATAAGKLAAKVGTGLVGETTTHAATARDTTQAMSRAEDSQRDAISAVALLDHRTTAIGAKRHHQNAGTTGTMAGAMIRLVLVIVTRVRLKGSIRGRSGRPITAVTFKQTSGAHIKVKARLAIAIGWIAQAMKSLRGSVMNRRSAGVGWTRCAIGISAVADRKGIAAQTN